MISWDLSNEKYAQKRLFFLLLLLSLIMTTHECKLLGVVCICLLHLTSFNFFIFLWWTSSSTG